MKNGWEKILQRSKTVLFKLSPKGVVLSVTPNFSDLTGLNESDIIGKHFFGLMPAAEQERWGPDHLLQLQGNESLEVFSSLNIDGRSPVDALISVFHDPPDGFSGSATLLGSSYKGEEVAFRQQEIIRSTLQSIDDLVFVTDTNGVFTECYPGNQDNNIFFSSDLFMGKNFDEVGFPPDVSGKFFKSLNEARHSGKTQQIQYSLKVFGSEFFYQAKLTPRFDNQGRFEGITAICRDITSLKKIEKQLMESRDFYLTILQKFPTLVWRAGKDGGCDFFNDTWLEFTGQPLKKQLGFGWMELVHEDDRVQVERAYFQAISRKSTYRQEYRLRHHSGKYRWVQDIGRPVYSLQNDVTGFIGSCIDIHQEKTNQRLLVESEERYRNIVELQSDLVCRWLPDTTLTYANRPYSSVFGFEPQEILGKKWRSLYSDEDSGALDTFVKEINADPSSKVLEHKMLNETGSVIWIQWVSSPIFDASGNFVEFQSVGRDITERIRQEEEREKLLEKLNRRVRELTFLNEFSSVTHHPETSLEKIFRYLVDHVPEVFRKPVSTWARITLDKEMYAVKGFRETDRSLSVNFGDKQGIKGVLELFFRFSSLEPEVVADFMQETKTFLNIIRDVLETFINKHEAEHQLHTTQQKYLELFENITDIVFVMDSRGRLTSINPAMYNILGYRDPENLRLKNIVVPSSMPNINKALEAAISSQKNAVGFEADILTSDGNIKNFLVNCLIRYEEGGLYEIFGVARDVTESRHLSRKLIKAIVETEERERQRFAEELHDGLGPLLSGVKLYLQKADASQHLDPKDRKMINFCSQLANDAIVQTRIIANNLMPNVLADFGLVRALRSFTNKINELGKIRLNLTSNDEQINLQPVEYTVVYRVLTELINNALKHSDGDTIDIDLKWSSNVLRVTYFENGKKFNPLDVIQQEGNKGMGLRNIVNRIKSINGVLEFNKGNTHGFQVKLLIAKGHEGE
jgi:PAS domain S-box-containing protein